MDKEEYQKELDKLQTKLVQLQSWVVHANAKVVIVFEGRDAAGKGGIIRRITEKVSSRRFRVVALPAPTDRQKSQIYFQRYIEQMPAGGEVVIFDRSWYNRAGVERVMGFCTDEEYEEFLITAPKMEAFLIREGIILVKYFLEVSQEEQEKRFLKRIHDVKRQWKLSPMDLESYARWWDYTKAIDRMLEATDTEFAPWNIVKSDDKEAARLNCISHLLDTIPWEEIPFDKPELPKIKKREKGIPVKPMYTNYVPELYK